MEIFEDIYERTLSEEFKLDDGYLVSCKPLSGRHSFLGLDTMWVGRDGKHEVRKPSLADCRSLKAHFNLMNIPITFVTELEALYSFLRIGGHAVVSEDILKRHWANILEPRTVVSRYYNGFLEYDTLDNKYKQRFVRGNFRMEVFERDNYQCRICGACPDDSAHIRLEAHHIRPWVEGGVSSPENLITLCATCHEGAGVINRDLLYRKIGLSFPRVDHELIPLRRGFTGEQLRSYTYLLSNTVVLRTTNIPARSAE